MAVLRNRFRSRGVILSYHRIASPPADPWQLSVTPAHFAEHVDVLSRIGRTLPLREVVRALRDGKMPRRFLVVTFDDGYEDNLRAAKPLLERRGIPATVFLTAGAIGKPRGFWWDELERLVFRDGPLPALTLELPGETEAFGPDEADRSDAAARERHRHWRPGQEVPSPRHAVFLALHARLSTLLAAERERAMAQIRVQVGTPASVEETGRPLSHDEVLELARGGLIEIGAHSLTHPRLAVLPVAVQRTEVSESRRLLEDLLGTPVSGFAYPFGRPGDFSAETTALVKEAGFSAACASTAGTVGSSSDCFRLPRYHIEDCDGSRLERRVSRWLAA